MKSILSAFAALMISAGVSYAGCGKKTETTGTLKSYDAETKMIVVDVDGSDTKVSATPSTEVKSGAAEAKMEDLVGKKVKVISEHKKADSVTAEAA